MKLNKIKKNKKNIFDSFKMTQELSTTIDFDFSLRNEGI